VYGVIFKAFFDRLFAIILLILSFPLFLTITVLLWFVNSGQPFFVQMRPGKDEVLFKLLKFRSMTNERDNRGNLLSDEIRLTELGKFIRATSLDELPQLVNVLKGEMSFVGPRPLLVEYLELYNENQIRRHEVKPGITGWAQVNGRNAISWEQKFEYDIWYIDNYSFYLDIKVLLLTTKKVLNKEGVTSQNSATTENFKGSKNNRNETK